MRRKGMAAKKKTKKKLSKARKLGKSTTLTVRRVTS
jgi:hypothetical protein